jgi:hypothetical protein
LSNCQNRLWQAVLNFIEMKLSSEEKKFLIERIAADEALPDDFQEKLFPTEQKEYELRYGGKMRREDVLADLDGSFAAPRLRRSSQFISI